MKRPIKCLIVLFCIATCVQTAFAAKKNCFVSISSDGEISDEVITNLAISLISNYVESVREMPISGAKKSSCVYFVTTYRRDGTLTVTLTGRAANGTGNAIESGVYGFQSAFLRALYKANTPKQSNLCQDFPSQLSKECGLDVNRGPATSISSTGKKQRYMKGICSVPGNHKDYRHCDLARFVFNNLDLSGSDFSGVDLKRARFNNCVIVGTNFKGADLERARFSNVRIKGALFSSSDMDFARFLNSTIESSDFSGSELERSHFSKSTIEKVTFAGAKLERANFDMATLNIVDFSGADLGRVSFDGATLNLVDLRDANIEDTDLSTANLGNIVR